MSPARMELVRGISLEGNRGKESQDAIGSSVGERGPEQTLKTDAGAPGDLLSIFSQDPGCPENPRQQGWDFLSEFRLG